MVGVALKMHVIAAWCFWPWLEASSRSYLKWRKSYGVDWVEDIHFAMMRVYNGSQIILESSLECLVLPKVSSLDKGARRDAYVVPMESRNDTRTGNPNLHKNLHSIYCTKIQSVAPQHASNKLSCRKYEKSIWNLYSIYFQKLKMIRCKWPPLASWHNLLPRKRFNRKNPN
jgi:hypothetical protein